MGDINVAFRGSTMKSFDEFRYFTGVTAIAKDAFNSCSLMERITLPDTIKSIGSSAFFNCRKLKEIIIPNGVTAIGRSAFQTCLILEKAVLPPDLTTIPNGCFQGCLGLRNINFPPQLTGINSYAFSGTSFENMVLPESLSSLHGTAFSGCANLKSIYIGSNVATITGAVLQNCPKLATINVSPENQYFRVDENVLFSGNELIRYPQMKPEIDYSIPGNITAIRMYAFQDSLIENIDLSAIISIGDYAFYKSNIKEVILNNIQSLGAFAFHSCGKLENVEVTSLVLTSQNATFIQCPALKRALMTSPLISGGSVFNSCTSLYDVTLENLQKIGSNMF